MTRFLPSEMKASFNGVVEKIKSDSLLSPAAAETRDVILSNLGSIKDLLFHFRYPRIAILGDSKRSRVDTLSLFLKPELLRKEMMLGGSWYGFEDLEIADFRGVKDISLSSRFPDLILCLVTGVLSDDELEEMLLRVAELQEEIEDEVNSVIESIFLIEEKENSRQFYKIRKRLQQCWRQLEMEGSLIFPVSRRAKISEELIRIAPTESELSLVRGLSDDETRSRYIDSIINLATATNSTIATVPIPVADLIPITTVQTLMLVSIAYAHGRNLDAKTITAFLGSLGINLSVGFAMREIVRALSQFIPVAGPFVSATIAASTTATLGKKASAYFEA